MNNIEIMEMSCRRLGRSMEMKRRFWEKVSQGKRCAYFSQKTSFVAELGELGVILITPTGDRI